MSQSTSAVHLHSLEVGTHTPRKLSKRRMPALVNIFGGQTQQSERNAVSLPVSPVERIPDPPSSSVLPKRLSATPTDPLSLHNGTTSKKEKRGSVLGRIVKKFSILRKPMTDQWHSSRDDWQHVSTNDAAADLARQDNVTGGQLSPEKDPPDTTKRIPPPSLADPSSVKDSGNVPEADRSSSISVETPYPIGRLTIANPDVPGSSDDTPTQDALPLLPEKSEIKDRGRPSLQNSTNISCPVDPNPHVPVTSPRQTSISSAESRPPIVPDKTTSASVPPILGSRETGSEAPVIPMSINSLGPPFIDMVTTAPPQKTKDVSTNSIRSYVNQSLMGDAHSSEIRSKAHSSSIVDLPLKPAPARPHHSDRPPYNPPLPSPPSTSPSPSAPFPLTDTTHPRSRSTDSFVPYDYSPLSASSMLANPPTPYSTDISIPPSPEPLPPSLPPTISQDRKRSSREPSPNSNMVRQTETFKLVRSSSTNIFASSDTIVAGGQQWEVVESLENKSKGRTPSKSNDRETGSRRDQRRDGRYATDNGAETETRNQVRNHRSYKPPPSEHARSNSSKPVVDSTKERPAKSVRKKEDGRPSHRKRSPTNLDVNKPQPPPPPPTPGAPPARQLERQASTSARPTSELPSAAEMNALRAKEAWDMERLWKARSVYGHDSREFATSALPLAAKDEKDTQNVIHGSSHTAFVVQSPFQSHPSHIYHSMPTIPSPMLYSSSIPTSSQPFPSTQQYSSKQSPQSFDQKTASTSRLLSLTNPLPEPPRASSYEPSPLSF